jgi:hypothetical protein
MSLFSFLFGPKKHTCKTKRRFDNEASAQAALNLINPRRKPGKPFRSYKCPQCHGYHLSSKPAHK